MKAKRLIVILLAILLGISVCAVFSMKGYAAILERTKLTKQYKELKRWEEKQFRNFASTGRKLVKSIPEESKTGDDIKKIEDKIIGKHMCSLQWISWDYFGSVNISRNESGKLTCKGGQKSRENDDFLTIDGTIKVIDEKHLIFNGTIVTKVSYINKGNTVTRKGKFNFVASGSRKYWRMQEMGNPKDCCTDYVDIYF